MCLRGGRHLLTQTNKLFMSFRSLRHTGYIRCHNVQPDTHKHAAQQPLSFRRPRPPSDIITSSQLPSFLPAKRVFVTGKTPQILGAVLLLQRCSTAADRNAAPLGSYLSFLWSQRGGGWYSRCGLCARTDLSASDLPECEKNVTQAEVGGRNLNIGDVTSWRRISKGDDRKSCQPKPTSSHFLFVPVMFFGRCCPMCVSSLSACFAFFGCHGTPNTLIW